MESLLFLIALTIDSQHEISSKMLRDLFGRCIKLKITGKSEERKIEKIDQPCQTLLYWEGSFSHFSPFSYYHKVPQGEVRLELKNCW